MGLAAAGAEPSPCDDSSPSPFMPLHCCSLIARSDTPVLERVPIGHISLDFPAVRTGPDPLPLHSFEGTPREIRWAAYWYRNHLWCADASCSHCATLGAEGEGVCVIGFADETYGFCSLNHEIDRAPVAWESEQFRYIALDELKELCSVNEESASAYAGRWGVGYDAARGISRALRFADVREIVSGKMSLRRARRI